MLTPIEQLRVISKGYGGVVLDNAKEGINMRFSSLIRAAAFVAMLGEDVQGDVNLVEGSDPFFTGPATINLPTHPDPFAHAKLISGE